jgi:hypothetical protein
MKNVKNIRQRLTIDLVRLRSYISMTEGNVEVVDRLRGEEGEKRMARIITFILSELGHESDTPVETKSSQLRRTISRVRGADEPA